MIEVRLLGELELRRGGRPVALPASKRTRALLAYLIATERGHLRSHLCDLLWEMPDDPRASLRWSLTKLRPLVGGHRLEADRERVAFVPDGMEIDVGQVRQALGMGVEAAPTDVLRATAGRFRGEFLEGLDLEDCRRFQAWLLAERDAWRSLQLSVLAALVQRLADQPEEAMAAARARVGLDPLSEAAHADVVRLLGVLGRPREAVEQYDACRRLLETEMGRTPSAILEDARRALRAPVAALSAAPSPVPAVRSATPPLVGRATEQAELGAALTEGGPVFLLLGEPGIGKSALLEAFRTRAQRDGCVVLAARAFETETARPYGPWIDALRGVAAGSVPESLRPDLSLLVPELDVPGPDRPERHRLFESVAELLSLLGRREHPVVLVLDDVQWLDPASAALLHYVARALRDRPVVLALGVRPGELADNPAALKLVRALGRETRLRELRLAPLDDAETARLVAAVAPGVDARRVAAESGGHPLLAVTVARALAEGRDTPADSLGGLIDDALARLDPAARDLVPWAAALGRGFDLDTLAAVSDRPAADVLASVLALERHGIVRALPGDGGYDFVHDLVRDGAYRRLAAPGRRLLHARIARHLDALADVDGARAAEVARHAALAGDSERAAAASLRAGDRCIRLFAYAEAAAFAERGLTHLAALPAARRLVLHVGLLRLFVHSALTEAAAQRIEREIRPAIDEANALGRSEVVREAHDVLTFVHWWRGDHNRAHEDALRAAAAAEHTDPADAARTLAMTGRCLVHLERDLPHAVELLGRAESLGRMTGSDPLDVSWGLGLLDLYRGRHDAAVPRLTRVRDLAKRGGHGYAEWDSQIRLAMLELERERPDEALRHLAGLDEVVARMQEGSEPAFAAALEALARRERGEPGSDDRIDVSIETLRALDARWMLAYVASFAALSALESGDPGRARRLAEEAAAAAQPVGRRSEVALARVVLARLDWRAGDRGAAAAHLAALLEDGAAGDAVSARARRAVEDLAALLGTPIPTIVPTAATTAGR